MPSPSHSPLLWTAVGAVVGPLCLYVIFLALGSTPYFQRHFLYAHRINTLWWRGVNEPERFGFANGQATPFFLKTPDGESIYTWHIAPLPFYLQHEDRLAGQPRGVSQDFASSESLKLLKEDPKARVVISLHGNAGDIAQGCRPDSYHALTDTSSYHVFAIDYRGYGHSSGTPSEHGLIQDAATVIDFVIKTAGVSPDRIVLLGQSLGTAVASGVSEHYAAEGIEFGGIVLVAGFSTLPKMLSGYRIGGIFPVFGPFARFPPLVRLLERCIWDKWHSVDRLERLVGLTKKRLRLMIVAAKDDADIPCTESNKLFQAAAKAALRIDMDDKAFDVWKAERTLHKQKDAFVATLKIDQPDIIIRQEQFPYGGHNNIMGYSPVILAVLRCFDVEGTTA
ncbi:abhydrolase [Plectosphaerella cucumerina]|uniref:Abhydrolase n=1 Tax=Plectosphaerella cucumerina TaxID=40658 RepID=A0A8K0TEB6_9PEZI|nr:abhydrolase [Plectosphaerella cucumerina]